MATLQVKLQKGMIERVDSLAHDQGCGVNQVVNEALERYLKWHEKQMHLWNETEKAIEQADRG